VVRILFPERTRRRIGLLSLVVALALPACGAASAGTRPEGPNPTRSGFGDAGTMGCVDSASFRRAATAPGESRPIARVPGSGTALRKVATPIEAPAVASVPASGGGQPVAVRATAKTAFGGMRAAGTAPAGNAGPCG
jgi:hypothetical protein